MPTVFGGRVYFLRNECAYLEPGNKVVNVVEPNCQLSIKYDFGNPQPVDSVEVYLYQSGNLDISFSSCEYKTETDIYIGQTRQYQVCRAKGTFNLTLVNKNNVTISIINGSVNELIRL